MIIFSETFCIYNENFENTYITETSIIVKALEV